VLGLEQYDIVSFRIVEHGPRRAAVIIEAQDTISANRFHRRLDSVDLQKDHRFVARRIVLHAFLLRAKENRPGVELGMVAELLTGEA